MAFSYAALLVLLLPLAAASCPPGDPDPLADPGKCFTCPEPDRNPTKNNRAESWTDFYCKYWKRIDYSDGTSGSDYTSCYYNDDGNLLPKDTNPPSRYCPSTAVPVKGCEQVKQPVYKGPYEKCCGEGCKLETEKCFYCPKAFGVWVDVTAAEKQLECTYHYTPGAGRVTTCNFNTTDGTLIPQYDAYETCQKSTVAPQRAECLKNKPPGTAIVPGKDNRPVCAAGPGHDECEQEREKLKGGYTYCPYEGACESDDCWTCPKLKDTDSVEVRGFRNKNKYECRYTGNSPAVCTFNPQTGNIIWKDGPSELSYGNCPSKGVQSIKCLRTKAGKRNIRMLAQ